MPVELLAIEDIGESEGEAAVVQKRSELNQERKIGQQSEPEVQMDKFNSILNEHRSLKDDISNLIPNPFLDQGLDPNLRQKQRQRHIQCPHKDRAQIKYWFTYESEIPDV